MINLIINADDFGMSKIFNKSILSLMKEEKIKSISVLVNRITEEQKEQVEELIKISKKMKVSVGLHLDFESRDYNTQIKMQYKKFQQIFNANPSHLDIHKALLWKDAVPIVADFCKEKKLPCRNKGGTSKYWKTTDAPAFHGTTDNFEEIDNWIKTLEEGKWYEILFHPGMYDPNCKSSLNKERELDTKHIHKLHSILKKCNIKLVSYHDVATAH